MRSSSTERAIRSARRCVTLWDLWQWPRGRTRPGSLTIAGLAETELVDPDELVAYERGTRLWAELVRRFQGEPLGIRYSETWSPESSPS